MMLREVSLVKHYRQYYRWALPGPRDRSVNHRQTLHALSGSDQASLDAR
jgi:hypothetical protein